MFKNKKLSKHIFKIPEKFWFSKSVVRFSYLYVYKFPRPFTDRFTLTIDITENQWSHLYKTQGKFKSYHFRALKSEKSGWSPRE